MFQFWSLYLLFIFSGRNAAGKGVNYAYQGVQPANGLDEDNYIRHAYYQWVPFVLFLQGNEKWAFFQGCGNQISPNHTLYIPQCAVEFIDPNKKF